MKKEEKFHGLWRKTTPMCKLSLLEKTEIIHEVLVKCSSHKDTACKFRVKPQLVQYLVAKAKKDKNLLEKLRVMQEENISKTELVMTKASSMLSFNIPIHSAGLIKAEVQKEYNIVVTESLVRKILKEELGWKYKSMKRVSYQGNSERCLI